jgi:chemotaxis signal transduction protein
MSTNFNPSVKTNFTKFDSLLQDISSSALLAKHNLDQIDTADIRHGFTVSSYALLVPKGVRTEVIQAGDLYPLPNMPNWFSGFVNHRGEALPVFYLEALFNPPASDKKNKQWILFLEQQQKTCGILMDNSPYKVNSLTEMAVADVSAIPESIKPYVEKAFSDGVREWLDFSYHPFFLSLKSAF